MTETQPASPSPDPAENTDSAPLPAATVTSLNRRWLFKMAMILLLTGGLGIWGAYDGLYLYPKRGIEDAEFKLKLYLEASEKAAMLFQSSVDDPAAELDELRAKHRDITTAPELDRAKYLWLSSVSLVASLDRLAEENSAGGGPATALTPTRFPDPGATLAALRKKWDQKSPPVALSAFDIPVQYVFMVVGIGAAAWLILHIARSARMKYRYDPASGRLTLPSGKSFVPTDIDDIDRRLWHKFYVTIKLLPEAGADEVRLDLLRFTPLEEWFLNMEKRWPKYVPPEVPAEEPAAAGTEAGSA